MGRAFSRICLFVCLSVRALTRKRLELSTPVLVHIYSYFVTDACLFLLYLSKPAKQVWYWALRVYWEPHWPNSVCMYVCMYVCMWSNSSQTTEPICIKIIPANRAFYADCCRLLRFEIFTKYDEYFVIERTPFLNKRASPQHRSVDSNDNVNDVTAEWRTQSVEFSKLVFLLGSFWVASVIYSILVGSSQGRLIFVTRVRVTNINRPCSSELGSRNSEIYENSSKQIKWRNFTFSYKLISI